MSYLEKSSGSALSILQVSSSYPTVNNDKKEEEVLDYVSNDYHSWTRDY